MNVLGLWDGHDAGAALITDGRIVAAINEERLTRRKLEVRFPARSIAACLEIARLPASHVQLVAISTTDPAKTLGRWAPWTKERYYTARRRLVERGPGDEWTRRAKLRMTEWNPNPLTRWLSGVAVRRELEQLGFRSPGIRLLDHHACHAAAAVYTGSFESCLAITVDGVGDGRSATVSTFRPGTLTRIASTPAADSLGVLFELVTNLLNLRELEDEGKVMALADYAAPIPDDQNPILSLVAVDGLRVRLAVPGHALKSRLRRVQFRVPNEQLAWMVQRTVECTLTQLVQEAVRATGLRRVALAGGVVSNVKATRAVRLLPDVDDVYVFPHMGDGGLALGAAALALAEAGRAPRLDLGGLDFGPEYPAAAIREALARQDLHWDEPGNPQDAVIDLLLEDQVVLWFQGRMEYGPRALGYRSVLARPDRPDLRDRLNLVLKRRVWYQPFCPSILEGDARRVFSDWKGTPDRYMAMSYAVRGEHLARLAGVVSVDGTCRPQIVADEAGGPFADLLRGMRARVGLGAVLNTSFNIHGEPLVCTPEDAIDVFLRSGADALCIGPYLVRRQRAACRTRDERAA